MKPTRQQQKEATRRHILDQARALFTAQGFATPAKEIARAAAVSEGSLFAHFGTMEHLTTCAVEDFGGHLTRELHAAAHGKGSVRDFLAVHLEVLGQHEAFYARLVAEQAQLPEEAQRTFRCLQSAASHHLEERLRQDPGIKTLPHYIIFNSWMGLVHYYLANRPLFQSHPAESVLQRHKAVLVDSFITMITA